MPDIINPTQLVEEFKKSGEFDRLRRELLADFRNAEGFESFMSRVEDITRRKLAEDGKILSMTETSVYRELTQELNRYPLVERAVAETPKLNDAAFIASVRERVSKILREDRGEKEGEPTPGTVQNENGRPPLSIQTLSDSKPQTNGGQERRAGEDGYSSSDSAMLESPVSEQAALSEAG